MIAAPSRRAATLRSDRGTTPRAQTAGRVLQSAPSDYTMHGLTPQRLEVIQDMAPWVEAQMPRFLKGPGACWQPTDLLPDSTSPDFLDEVAALQAAASQLPTDLMVVLVGDMVTEEALPSYMGMLNRLEGTLDETGAQPHPWARWTRAWTAEENRHGDALHRYLYLSGQVDMRAVQGTVQRLIGSGLDPQLERNPYLCFVYTSFQERATKVSHGGVARLAAYHGDETLTRVCGAIAADESRHEAFYTAVVAELFGRDPEGALLAFATMMRKGVVMPGHLMDDGWHDSTNGGGGGGGGATRLFQDYAAVADAVGVYTVADYAAITDHLVSRWGVSSLRVAGAAADAQHYLCSLGERLRRLGDLQMERRLRDRRAGRQRAAGFSWVRGREVIMQ